MNSIVKKRFWKIGKWSGGLFVALFIFRLMYGYFVADSGYSSYPGRDFFGSVENLRKNYASEKIAVKSNLPQHTSMASSQKYEKIATVTSKTAQFDADQSRMNTTIRRFHAVIQYEQSLGNKGAREWHLLIGVNPASFDSFYRATQKIGVIKTTEITKIDKTNEYRKLHAKRSSLEKTLASLNELKLKGGQISDFVSLHDKILEIETNLQELGVELGDFDTENEFCTVRFSLYEGATAKKAGIFQRVKVALEWTIKYYAIIIFTVLCLSILSFVFLQIIDKLNILKNVVKKFDE